MRWSASAAKDRVSLAALNWSCKGWLGPHLRGWLTSEAVAVFGSKVRRVFEGSGYCLQPNPPLKRTHNGGADWLAFSISAAPLWAA
jgi:hypothetical protein